MTLFEWLLAGHLVGDFLLQTRWMAENKTALWFPLAVHSTVYTAAVTLFSLAAGGLSPPAVIIVFLSHLFLDRRGFVNLWARYLNRSDDNKWLKIMIDQTLHVLVLVFAILIS
ncbi:MAG: DUF3307 domain-containing protein [Ammonifex sp.]|jgi:hypothetical protein|nr:MAG: DUF3307 domain-containing protein [Ammonifex sp.]